MNWQLLIFSISAVYALALSFDFIAFNMRSAPKETYFSRRSHTIAPIFIAACIFYILNGMEFG